MIDPNDQVGYLLLQNTAVYLRLVSGVDVQQLHKKWLNISIHHSAVSNNSLKEIEHSLLPCSKKSKDELQQNRLASHTDQSEIIQDENSSNDPSPRNYVILTCDSAAGSLTILSSDVPLFDGTIFDMKCHSNNGDIVKKYDEADENRSDGAMLFGTAWASCQAGYARIETLQIKIRNPISSTNHRILSQHTAGSFYCKVLVDMVITVSLPHLEVYSQREAFHTKPSDMTPQETALGNLIVPSLTESNTHSSNNVITTGVEREMPTEETIRPKRKRSDLGQNTKALPSVVQLFYTLLRSDWDLLNNIQTRISHTDVVPMEDRPIHSTKSLFPSHLSLTQIYDRIECGRHSASIQYQTHMNGLPDDILLHGIAPFLNAKSLYSFRCTCKHVYTILKSTVPGLKLHLYPHQVETLEWMQKREAKIVSSSVDDDSLFQAIHGGRHVRVRSRYKPSSSSWTIDCTTGIFSSRLNDENNIMDSAVGRGGFCCDAPGTGKTITILSLILRTMGQMTNTQCFNESGRNLDDEIFKIYWKDVLVHDMKTSVLFELMKELRENIDFQYLQSSVEISKRMNEIRLRVPQGFYHNDFDLLCHEIDDCIRSVSVSTSESPLNSIHHSTRFPEFIGNFKSSCLKRSFKRQNKQISLLIKRKSISDYYSRLHSSQGTLIIVPKALMSHWVNQIKLHAQHSFICGSKIPIIFRYKKVRKQSRSSSSFGSTLHEWAGEQAVEPIDYLISLGSHQPFLFIDEDPTLPLPSSAFLAKFFIVLSSNQRLSNEKNDGSIPIDKSEADFCYRICPFLEVFWLRLVVDEGHTTGNLSTNASEMCCQISAERRWCVTGTPTPETKTNDGLKNVLGLLTFIKYAFFNPQEKDSLESFRKGHLAAFFQFQFVLQGFMARQSKEGIIDLCRPELRDVLIDMSPNEIATYNTLVSAVQGNILITTMEGKTSGYQDCLLNPLMSTHAQSALNNLRLACLGGARISTILKERDIDRVLGLLRDIHNVDDIKLRTIHDLVRRMTNDEASSCMLCGMNLQTFLVLPCACFLCTECMTNKMTTCPVCCKAFDVDDFQRLQPGIAYNWSLSGEINKGEEHLSSRIINNQEHRCNFLNEATCSVCSCIHSPCPQDETKASYVIDKILNLSCRSEIKQSSSASKNGCMELTEKSIYFKPNRPLKIIIFSQFRQMLNIIGDRLIRRLGSHCVAEFWGSTKHHELERFARVKDCICLLLGRDGAHGLDLSFVTHIIFLDHIMDESVRNQVVSRAYRLGASGSVIVEQLVARGTVEELIGKFSGSHDTEDHQITKKGTGQLRFLLQNVTFIRPAVPLMRNAQSKKAPTKSVRFVTTES